jgi:hypothetical protein
MTALLEQAIQRLSGLSESDQNAYASRLLAALDGDQRWDDLFAATDDRAWDALVRDARDDAEQNGTLSLDELKAAL